MDSLLSLGWLLVNILQKVVSNRSAIGGHLTITCLLDIDLLCNAVLGLFKGLYKKINSRVEFAQELLHVFLLALDTLWFFIGVEIFGALFISRSVISILLSVFLFLSQESCWFEVLEWHESLSSLKSFSLNVLSSLREQLTEIFKLRSTCAHENDFWKIIKVLLGFVWVIFKGSENDVWL